MASNGTEIEQLLLEALNSLIGILRNNTSLAASSSDGDDNENSLTTTANRLALSATIISIAAFVIALLQAVLQYAGANESVRQKCNSAAIGVWSAHVRKRWSLRSWRRKFYYPELHMSASLILRCKRFEESESKLKPWMRGLQGEGRSYSWKRSKHGDLGFDDFVSDGIWTLCYKGLDTRNAWCRVMPRILPWKYWLIWKCFEFLKRPRESYQARATWAQLLDLFAIGQHDMMVLGTTDAECIPVAIDIPTQTVSFDFLGKISFFMGLTSVKINAVEREFSAFGELGSITTESIPGYGRVVRFQRNSRTRLCLGASLPARWQLFNLGQVVGELSIPRMMDFKDKPIDFRIQKTGYLYRPIEEALLANANDLAAQLEQNKTHKDPDFWPQRLPWQNEMSNAQIVWPSLLLAATVAEIPVVVTAFPSDALLRPFTQIFARVATQAKQREGETYDLMTVFEIESLIFEERFLEVLTNGVFHVTRTAPPGTNGGLSGWAFREMDTLEELDHYDAGGYEPDEIWDQWNDLMSPVLKHLSNSNANRNTTKKPVILPITNELLRDFDVIRWRQSLDDIRRIHYPQVADKFGRMTRRHHPRAEQLLWLQVYLLDREIQQVMKYLGSDLQSKGVLLPEEILFPPNKLGNLTSKIINAIRSAWSNTQEDSKQEPLVALERMVALELGVSLSEGDVSFYVRQLTDLLKLRCVFFAAYMMVIPDSSDFMRYHHSGVDIRLPMI